MRILQVIDSLNTGGAEMMCVRIANELANVHGRSYVIATRSIGSLQNQLDPRVVLECINKSSAFDVFALGKMFSFVLKHRINVIHAHSNSVFFGALIKLFAKNLTLIWHDHYGDSDHLINRRDRALRLIAKLVDGVISVNQKLKNWSIQRLKIKNVVVINNIVDLDKYRFSPRSDYSDQIVIALVANFRPQKDHEYALNIFRKLNVIDPSKFRFLLVGNIVDNAHYQKIIKTIQSLGLTIEIKTNESNSAYSIAQSHVCILTSKSEGMPLALLEYGAIGRPIITTGVGQIPDIFCDRQSCIICKSDDPDGFAQSILEVVNDKDLRSYLISNSHELVQQQFSGKSFTEKYIAFILKTRSTNKT